MTDTSTRNAAPLRADAARNRERIMAAAATAYATTGPDVSLEEVARLAEVGVGTVYRRFPTRQALREAVLEETMYAYASHTEQMAELAATEPWEAFRQHVLYLLGTQSCNLTFSSLLRHPGECSGSFQTHHRRALAASRGIVGAALSAGVLRDGFRHDDLLLLAEANHGVVQSAGKDARAASQRFGTYMLSAFHA